MSEIVTEKVTVTTTGADGSAAGNADSGAMHGFLLDIYLDYHASTPATADVTVAYQEPDRGNILVVSNSATDTLYAPMKQVVDAAGAAITGVYVNCPLNGQVNVAVAGGNALTGAVVAYIRYYKI